MKQSQRIAKNIIVILSSEVLGFGLNFFIIIVIARYLGTIGFGHYSFIMAFVGVFQLIADSGLSNIMTREIAVNRDNLNHLFGVTKSLTWAFSIIVFILISLIISIINSDETVRTATYIMGIAVLATVHAAGYNAIFRAMEEMEYNAIGFVLHKFLLLTLIISVIHFRLGLIEIALSYMFSNSALWLLYYAIVRYRYLRLSLIVNIKEWWYFISEAVPLGIASLLRKISWQVDILILSAISTTLSVGLFSAPYKIIQAINLLPHSLTIPLFPFFSRLAAKSHKELFQAYEKNMKFMYLLCFPLVIVLIAFSKTIISLIFGPEFESSSIALQILSLSVIFLFPTAQFVYLFSALGKQRLYTISSFISLAINIALDFILIPKFDFVGACIGTFIAEISLFGTGIYFIKSMDRDISIIKSSWKPIASGIVMLAVLYQFKNSSLYLMLCGIFAGLLAYIVLNILLKTLSKNELSLIKESILFMKKGPAVLVTGNEIK